MTLRRSVTLLAAACALCAFSGVAEARTEAAVPYTRAQTFSAALRYLRVDLGYEVTEKDPEAAYLLFSYASSDRKAEASRGAIEVVQREHGVRVFVSLPQLPSYHEEVLKQGLVRKLAAEYGDPGRDTPAPERKKPKPDEAAPKEPSGDKDKGKDDDAEPPVSSAEAP
jgi:hypothetical protein